MAAVERLLAEPAAPPPAVADGIPPAARRRTASPAQVVAASLAGAVLLAFLAAADLPSWAERLPDRPLTPAVRETVIAWSRTVDRLGLAAPHRGLRRATQWLMDREW